MTAEGREDYLADPDFQDACREVVAGARRLAEESGVEEVMVFSAIAGGAGSSGVSLPVVPSPRRDDEFAEPLVTWLLRHEDRRYGLVWWWAIAVRPEGETFEWSRDELPTGRIAELIASHGLGVDLPHNWVLQRKAFDHRPAELLPAWRIAKLESVGAWDPERRELAVDEDCNPLSGRKLFGGDPDDEFYPGDDDDDE